MSTHSALPTAVGPAAAGTVLPCGRGAEPGGRRAGQPGRAEGPPALHAARQPVPLLPGEGRGQRRGRAELLRRAGLTGPLQGNGGGRRALRGAAPELAGGDLPAAGSRLMVGPGRPAGDSYGSASMASPAWQLPFQSYRAYLARRSTPLHLGRWGLGRASQITGG